MATRTRRTDAQAMLPRNGSAPTYFHPEGSTRLANAYFDTHLADESSDGGVGDAPETVIATVVHELRAPLTTLYVTLDALLTDPCMNDERRVTLFQSLHRGVVWMHRLVDNLDTWSALQTGQLSVPRSPISLSEWLDPAITLVHPILNLKSQQVRLTQPATEPIVFGDSLRLGQVVVNLLTNASRHAPIGDVIEIDVVIEGDTIRVLFRDYGPGIPVDQRERIFQPYVRDSPALGPTAERGLGLYIVRELVSLHGGDVGVQSQLGHGATFWFTLPTTPTAPGEDSVVDSSGMWGLPREIASG